MDKYIGDMLTEVGRDSRNDGYTQISEEDALRYANYAQEMLQSKIAKKYPDIFLVTEEQLIVANQKSYTPTGNLYKGCRIRRVRYNQSTTDERSWYRLKPISAYEVEYARTGYPKSYYRENGSVIIHPFPDTATGRIEIQFEKQINKLDLRRAQVNGTPSGAIIDLTSSSFGAPTAATEARFVKNTYVSVVDAFGTPLMRNGLISSYDAASDALTLAANVSTYLLTGVTLAALADGYLVIGKWASTHSELSNDCERYVAEYTTQRLYKRDSSNDAGIITDEMKEMEKDIVDGYKIPDKDPKPLPIFDRELLVYGYTESE